MRSARTAERKGRARRQHRAKRVRRQWGSDRRKTALAAVPRPATGRALSGARFAIFVTVAAWIAYLVTTLSKAFFGDGFSPRYAFDAAVYIVIVTLLVGSALAYLLARVGFQYRTRRHHRVPRAAIDDFFGEALPTLTVIVPSYREESGVVRQTLLSAALQEYPYLRVALLIDDPPNPAGPEHLAIWRLPVRSRKRSTTCWRATRPVRAGARAVRGSPAGRGRTRGRRHAHPRRRVLRRGAMAHRRRGPGEHRPRGRVHAAGRASATRRRSRDCVDRVAIGSRRRSDAQHDPDAAAVPATGVDIPCRSHELRTEVVCLAFARAQQGDEPEQLHPADGRLLCRARGSRWAHAHPGHGEVSATSRCRRPTTC